MTLDAEIKFRCTSDLEARFARIAKLERRNPSDLARIVYEDYIRQQERALSLLLNQQPDHPTTPPVPVAETDTAFLRRKQSTKKKVKHP